MISSSRPASSRAGDAWRLPLRVWIALALYAVVQVSVASDQSAWPFVFAQVVSALLKAVVCASASIAVARTMHRNGLRITVPHPFRFAVLLASAFIALSLISIFIYAWIGTRNGHTLRPALLGALTDTVMVIVVAVMIAFKPHFDQLRASDLDQGIARRARVTAANAQMQSHLLMNSLHSISAVMHEDERRAGRMIRQLTGLFESAFQDDAIEGSLRSELDFARRYLEIHGPENLRVEWEIEETTLDARVPRLILQPIVENCIKHGAARMSGSSVTIKAICQDGQLMVTVTDAGRGDTPVAGDPRRKRVNTGGVGLQNVRERLAVVWGHQAELYLERGEVTGTRTVVTMPFVTKRHS